MLGNGVHNTESSLIFQAMSFSMQKKKQTKYHHNWLKSKLRKSSWAKFFWLCHSIQFFTMKLRKGSFSWWSLALARPHWWSQKQKSFHKSLIKKLFLSFFKTSHRPCPSCSERKFLNPSKIHRKSIQNPSKIARWKTLKKMVFFPF